MPAIRHPLEICEYFRKVVDRISSDAGNRHEAIVILVARYPDGSIADLQMAQGGQWEQAQIDLEFALRHIKAHIADQQGG